MHNDYMWFLHLPKCSESPLQSTVDSNQNAGFCDFVFCKLIGRAATCQQMLQFPVQLLPQLVDTIVPASLVLKHETLTDPCILGEISHLLTVFQVLREPAGRLRVFPEQHSHHKRQEVVIGVSSDDVTTETRCFQC